MFPVKLEISYGSFVYKDMIEWDAFASDNSPEVFARLTVADLGEWLYRQRFIRQQW